MKKVSEVIEEVEMSFLARYYTAQIKIYGLIKYPPLKRINDVDSLIQGFVLFLMRENLIDTNGLK